MKKRTTKELTQIINNICIRIEKRRSAFIEKCPLLSNDAIGYKFSTKLEDSVLFRCKMEIQSNAPDDRSESISRNKLVIQIAQKAKLSRSQVRLQTANLTATEMNKLLSSQL